MRVAAVGECMIELSGAGSGLWRMGFAGDTFNTLWTLRALLPGEHACDYVSAFGDDPFSVEQIAFLARCGIGIAASPRIAGARPGLYAISLEGAERSFTYWRADAAARRLSDDPDALAESLYDRNLIYFSGISLAILPERARATLLFALERARATGSIIAFDPNYRPRLWAGSPEAQAASKSALALADIVLPTFPDEQALWGDACSADTIRRICASGVREAAIKDGAGPALVLADGIPQTVPALAVADAVDTTGAGDAFNGAYLAARLLGAAPKDAAEKAHRVAAAAIRVRGALTPFEVLQKAFV